MELLVKHSKYSYQILYIHRRPDYIRIRLNICDNGFKEVSLCKLPKSAPLYEDVILLPQSFSIIYVSFSNGLSFKLRNVL